MFEECPFNYALIRPKWIYFFIKTENKIKYLIYLILILNTLFIYFFFFKHINDKFDTLIFPIYLMFIFINVIVSNI